MLGRLNHVAVAVKNLSEAMALYRDVFGARVSGPLQQPEHGVTVAFVDLGNTKVELLEALGDNSPIAAFMQKNPDGGMHHLCYETSDIFAARAAFQASGGRVLGDGEPKIGAHGKPVLFLHPKDCAGVLIELEQA
jgi:methylmalonyl-CoA/ethylmalonyl-CoA epimerase